ncbi:MAG: hypothetical protein LBQ71_12300 [Hungatella sp.]|jgi:hypothetical protein|nr:hypothetical protein [Hungatella sp.]
MENASDSYGNNPALTKQDCSEKSCRCNRGCCSIGPTGPTGPQRDTGLQGAMERLPWLAMQH